MTRTPESEKGDTKDIDIEDRRKLFSKVPTEKKMEKLETYRKRKTGRIL